MSIVENIKNAQENSKIILNYAYIIACLNRFKDSLLKNETNLFKAFKKDLNKSEKEVFLTEINEVVFEIEYHLKNLSKWMKPKKVKHTVQTMGTKSSIFYKPVGKVLLISPFNYPVNLCFMPLVGAISAGNRVLVKASELTPNINEVIYKIISESFAIDHVAFVREKELKNYNELYEYKPDLVFFTGSTKVGKEIRKTCAELGIQCITKLGGQCPCIVHDIKNDAIYERIVWAKFINGGQTCVSINHIFLNSNIKDFIEKLSKEIDSQYPNVIQNKNMVRVINKDSFNRLTKIIETEKANILYGGKYNEETLTIEPTVIEIMSHEKIAKYGELFGPILFIYRYNENELNNVFKKINFIDKSPLAAYLFSNNDEIRKEFLSKINAGGYAINDAMSHILNHNLPFGGVFDSGFGSYHGFFSYEAFSFKKALLVNEKNKNNQIKFINKNNKTLQQMKKMMDMAKKFVK